jgi:hypothetical protein
MQKTKKESRQLTQYKSKEIVVRGQIKRVMVVKMEYLTVVQSSRVYYNHRRIVPTY